MVSFFVMGSFSFPRGSCFSAMNDHGFSGLRVLQF